MALVYKFVQRKSSAKKHLNFQEKTCTSVATTYKQVIGRINKTCTSNKVVIIEAAKNNVYGVEIKEKSTIMRRERKIHGKSI